MDYLHRIRALAAYGILTAFLGAAVMHAQLAAPAFGLDGQNSGIEIMPGEKSAGVSYFFKTWGPEEKRKQGVGINIPITATGWTNAWFSFSADKDGSVDLSIYGPYVSEGGKNKRVDLLFDDIMVEGASIKNGGFEQNVNGAPAGWRLYAQDTNNGPRYLLKRGVNNSACVMTWHNGNFSQTMSVKKGDTITVRLRCKRADSGDIAFAQEENRMNESTAKNLDGNDYPLNLAQYANMDFKDEIAGDGKGGWSDQGAENDFAGFDAARTDYRRITFSVVDPKRNDGKAVLTFKSENINRAITLDRAVIEAGNVKAKYLYLLHTACFANTQRETAATVTIRTKNGRDVEHTLIVGRDIADWWNPGHLPNALVAYRKMNKTSTVGLYLSRFAVGENAEEIESVTLATAGKAIWIVVGATLSEKEIDFSPPKFTIKNGDGWKPIDMSSVVIEPKSALDFSGLVEDGPAGKHGRVIVNAHGQMAFSDTPDAPVRFFAFNTFANHIFGYPETKLASSDEAQVKSNCERYAALVRRQGYNMIRFQGVDILISPGNNNDFEINQVNLDRLCYLIHCLKREGVYINLDMWSYNGYLKGAWDEASKRGLCELLMVDPASRTLWETGVRKLMAHKNPYTGTTFAEEKAVALVTMYNEQDIPVVINVFNSPKIKPFAEERWREYLKKRYGDIAGVERAWGKPFPSGTGLDNIPLFPKGSEWERTVRGSDVGTFIYERQRDLLLWYQSTLRASGYTGLSTQYDVIKYFRDHAVRNENPVIAMHTYHNHPTDISDGAGSRMGQDGAVLTSANYWRTQVAARYLNRPMCITEYNTMYWHRYRHEEGILFPSYSALQDFSIITAHAQSVILQAVTPLASGLIGRDPIGRAGQVMAAHLYGRRDVASSKHTVALAMNDAYIFTNGNMNYAVNSDQSKIALMCRFGLQYDAPIPAGLPPYPKADMTVPPADGAAIVASQWAASVLDNATGKDLDTLIDSMRSRGVLSQDNLSSAANGVFQSDTKEILMDTRAEQMTVVTPRFEGAVLKENKKAVLSSVRIANTSVAAAVSVASLDGKPVSQSSRLLLVYATDALNTGFEASDDRVTLVKNGTLPVLMQTGVLKVAVKSESAAAMLLWALGLDGSRKEQIPLAGGAAGEIKITIDTAALKNGPTPFFELAVAQ
ncbi:MAG: hypothetical protein HZC28_18610 [Spirochaetes bacterium]|nr:hypothetical protein [Spirochaetota bacterium]